MLTSEKIFNAALSIIFGVLAIVAVKVIGSDGFGVLFGVMSLLAIIKCLDLKDWFD